MGGPPSYSQSCGEQSAVLRMHAGNGDMGDLGERFLRCFDGAADDAELPLDPAFRAALHAYMRRAVDDVLSYSAEDAVALRALRCLAGGGTVYRRRRDRPPDSRVPCAAVDESNRRDRHADGCDPSSALPSDLHTRTGLARGMSFALCVADRGCPGSAGRGRSDRRLSNRYCRGQAHRLRAPEDRQRGRPQLPWVRRGHRAQPADSLAQEGIHHDRPRRASVARWSSTWRRRRSTRSKPDPRPGSRQVSGTQWSATVARTELAATDPVGPEGESGRPSDRFRPSG